MKSFIASKVLFILLFLSILTGVSFSQNCVLAVSLEDRLANSDLVVEATVLDQYGKWDIEEQEIYTVNVISVFNSLKGDAPGKTLEFITRGGIVDLDMQVDFPSLNLEKTQRGLFFLDQSKTVLKNQSSKKTLYEPTFNVLSFIQYDLLNDRANDHFDQYEDIENSLYRKLVELGYSIKDGIANQLDPTPGPGKRAVNISSFAPMSVTAGTNTQLTINGTGFGGTRGNGYVGFPNANDGGLSFILPLESQYISWSNTQIVVEVPSGAGGGNILVEDDTGDSEISSSSLTVAYNLSNVQSGGEAHRPNLVDADGSGGIEFVFYTDFYNDSYALDAFLRGLYSWRCSNNDGTGIYFVDGDDTPVDVITGDGVNVVRFDNGSELPSNVLGRTTSRYSGCFGGGGEIDWYLREVDMVFNDQPGTLIYSWNFEESDNSTSSLEYDFESVVLHELGHAHQLGHVNNLGNVMYFSISNGTEIRNLDMNDLDAGEDVLSFSQGVCGEPDMDEDYVCLVLPLEILDMQALLNDENNAEINLILEQTETVDRVDLYKSEKGIKFHLQDYAYGDQNAKNEQNFHFVDYETGPANYYRFEIFDQDGQKTVSDILFVRGPVGNDQASWFYPNPVTKDLSILMANEEEGNVTIKDIRGNIIRSKTVHLKTRLDVSNLPKGMYIIELQTASTRKVELLQKL